jgi:hypothetical protein
MLVEYGWRAASNTCVVTLTCGYERASDSRQLPGVHCMCLVV